MKNCFKIGLCLAILGMLCGITVSAAEVQTDTLVQAQKITTCKLDNLYRISDSCYRSEQPGTKQMCLLEKIGIRSILNLREYHTDTREARKTKLKLYHLRWAAGSITDSDVCKALVILRDAPKPILVHCWHGSDRTGTVIAAYRIVFENWSVEDAVNELKQDRFGHHETIYPNIEALIRSMDWAAVKKKILAP